MTALEKLLKASFKEEQLKIEGTTYIVKEMTAKDKSEYEGSLYTFKQIGKEVKVTPNMEGVKSKLVFYTLHDEQGQKVFKDLSDLPLVDTLPSSIIEMICDVAGKINGLNQEEVTKN